MNRKGLVFGLAILSGVIALSLLINQKMNTSSPETKDGFITLTAAPLEKSYRPGKKTLAWAFNQQIPGPTLSYNVGDILKVRFVNNLPVPSTIHWHGLELPANMDGSHISQKPVPPGETFDYKFRLLRAGTYWYHPHVDPNEQVEKGLYGALVVKDPNENLNLPEKEIVLMLDDVLLDQNNQVAEYLPHNPLERAVRLANGRLGNQILVNGQSLPRFDVVEDQAVRLRLINSANSRFFRLVFEDQVTYRIGGDLGLISEAEKIDPKKGLLMIPGERAEVYWKPTLPKDGQRFFRLLSLDTRRGLHKAKYTPQGQIDLIPDPQDGRRPEHSLALFYIQKFNSGEKSNLKFEKTLKPLSPPHMKNLESEPLRVAMGHTLPDKKGNIKFFIIPNAHHHHSGHSHFSQKMHGLPMMMLDNKSTLNAKVGESRIIEVVNMSAGIHPFHLHGFPFQLLETEYIDDEAPETNHTVKPKGPNRYEWKDTIAVPARLGYRSKSRTIMRLLVHFDDPQRQGQLVAYGGQAEGERSGGWMVHCHILEHSRNGMAAWLNLWPQTRDLKTLKRPPAKGSLTQ